MSLIKILIVEDYLLVAENLKDRLVDLGYLISGQADNLPDALRAFKKMLPDVVLLDIDLGKNKADGIKIAHEFNKIHAVPIIYLTALTNPSTIDRAKETKPAAYLIKPARPSQLRAALEVALFNFSQQIIPTPSARNHKSPAANIYPLEDSFFLRDIKRVLRKVLVADVLFVEAKGSAIEINLSDSTEFIYANLSSFQAQIPHLHLVRCHRSFVVNLSKVDAIDESVLKVGQHAIPMSKSYRDAVLAQLRLLKAD